MSRRRAVVVCPGRGTYNKGELGTLARFGGRAAAFVEAAELHRRALGQPGLRALDAAARYSPAVHGRGDNAAALIFAASFADFLSLDPDSVEVVAVTGNSMGWYTTLACAGALDGAAGFALANAMGARMHACAPGGQLIHNLLDEAWRPIPGRRAMLMDLVGAIEGLYVSIELGGMLVLAGTDEALAAFEARAPIGPGGFPMRLQGHAAFHTPLMREIAAAARAAHSPDGFRSPELPMVDGTGRIWRPRMTDAAALWDYTLGAQVTDKYRFSRAIAVAVREFAPDCLVLLGPGDTLGGAIIQSLLAIGWRGWSSKPDFAAAASADPFLISMGREDQRAIVAAA